VAPQAYDPITAEQLDSLFFGLLSVRAHAREGVFQMMSFIWWLIVGLIVGALARLILPGRDPMGWLVTMILGIAGSIVGGLISWAIWGTDTRGFRPAGFVLSLLGAIVLLLIWRSMKSRTTV
jgi:uncharacterized membrane protein YeaQ/YmgE (transglycosylase-associated protein family)